MDRLRSKLLAPLVLFSHSCGNVVCRAPNYAREMAAATTIQRAIHPAEVEFLQHHGRYAVSLAELSSARAALIPPAFSNGLHGGYKYSLRATPQGYQVNAEPTSQSFGSRTFYSDQSQVIHAHNGQEPATASDPELGSTAK